MLEFFDFVWSWLTSGIYEFFTQAFASLIEWLMLQSLDYAIWAVTFSWGIAKQVLTDLQISTHLNTAFSALPPDVASGIVFFRVPECITILLSAGVARIVLRFLPGI